MVADENLGRLIGSTGPGGCVEREQRNNPSPVLDLRHCSSSPPSKFLAVRSVGKIKNQ